MSIEAATGEVYQLLKPGVEVSMPDLERGGQRTERVRVIGWGAIEDILDSGLPRAYPPGLYQQKCAAVFEHVYESYPERDAGVYAAAG